MLTLMKTTDSLSLQEFHVVVLQSPQKKVVFLNTLNEMGGGSHSCSGERRSLPLVLFFKSKGKEDCHI